MKKKNRFGVLGRVVGGALAALVLAGGCGLDEVDVPIEFDGPSELGLSLTLRAEPDIIVADGFSTVAVRAELRNQNGQPVTGRDIFFQLSDSSGRFADIGSLSETTVRTNGQGFAQTIYRAPARTDATANQTILVTARPIGNDAAGAVYKSVGIELRSAEPRLFPGDPDNEDPNCSFILEAPNGFRTNVAILFQTTASDADGVIVRYEWDFGDGTREDSPDTAKVYRDPGTYTVIHVCTDNDGGQGAFQATLNIE
jgi:hypothetical protein